jgi:hypothetical protein
MVDLRSLPEQTAPGIAFLATPDEVELPDEYELLGTGDCREIVVTGAMRETWEMMVRYRPGGERMVDMLWDQLTGGADPAGEDFPPPLLPTSQGTLELHLGGHSLVKSQPFRIDARDSHRVIATLQRQYREAYEEGEAGRGPREFERQLLGYWGKQFGLKEPQDYFTPRGLPRRTPLPHGTIHIDLFDRANASSLGSSAAGVSWAQVESTAIGIAGQRASYSGTTLQDVARFEVNLSAANMQVEATLHEVNYVAGSSVAGGVLFRFASTGTNTFYRIDFRRDDTHPAGVLRIVKRVAGTDTTLADALSVTFAPPSQVKGTINGSAIGAYFDNTVLTTITDTSIATGLRGGIRARAFSTAGEVVIDDFRIADFPVGVAPLRRRRTTAWNRD